MVVGGRWGWCTVCVVEVHIWENHPHGGAQGTCEYVWGDVERLVGGR